MTKCILWTGAKTSRGYGLRRINKELFYVHRLALAEKLGRPIKKGYCACHSCDNTSCINPEHLFEATQQENILDMYAKKRNHTNINSKLSISQVKQIRRMEGTDTAKLSQMFGVSRRTIQSILACRSWKHI